MPLYHSCIFAPFLANILVFLQEGGVPTTDSLGSKSDNSAQVKDLTSFIFGIFYTIQYEVV